MDTFRRISLIQRNLVLLFYVIFCLALIFPLWMLFTDLAIPFSVNMMVIVFLAIIFVVVGSYFYLIVCLPDRLSRNFDRIRNDIASRHINNEEQFARKVNKFLIKQFNFIFLDIEYSAMGIRESGKIYFNDDFPVELIEDYDKFFKKSCETSNVSYFGVIRPLARKSHLYLIPIWFGDQCLGFLLVVTSKKLSSLFKGILSDFEDFYVDDQLMHVLEYQKLKKDK